MSWVIVLGLLCMEARASDAIEICSFSALSGKPIQAGVSRQGAPVRSAQRYITERGYVAATKEDLLDEAIFWAGMGSEKEFEDFVD